MGVAHVVVCHLLVLELYFHRYLLNCPSPPQQVGDIFRRAVALWICCLEQLDANNCRCDVGPRGCPHRRVHLDHLGD